MMKGFIFLFLLLSLFIKNESKIWKPPLFRRKHEVLTETKYSDLCHDFKYFDQYLDHFNLGAEHDQKYKQRYIISDKYWPGKNYPIFFYSGNEGDIQWFCENTGFMWSVAEQFRALVIFAEHRYYGQSLPFGNKSYDIPNIDYLTSEQTLADYAYLLTELKSSIAGAEKSPVITFGGSYGGMLSAWFRMKYPNVVAGALAASAPIFQFTTGCDTFSKVTTNTFKKADPLCPLTIAHSWSLINQLGASEQGLRTLDKIFQLCRPLEKVDDLKAWLNDVYAYTAMADYPYPANFLSQLPAWPVKVMCSKMVHKVSKYFDKDPVNLLDALYRGVSVYHNYTGQTSCTDIGSSTPMDVTMTSWDYQTCTEFVFPMCSNNKDDMFEASEWNFEEYSDECFKKFQVRPRSEWPILNFGSSNKDIKSHSNIIFSNGGLDPWSGGSVLESPSERLSVIMIEDGAHHLDLREPNSADTDSVRLARLDEIELIKQWIDEFNSRNGL